MRYLLIFIVSASICKNLNAQSTIPFSFQQAYDVQVSENNGEFLNNLWTGGFNAPQIHEIDFNRDGVKELVTLDRSGNRISIFETDDSRQTWKCNYTYKRQLPALKDWFIVRDYNFDGVEDIFHSNFNGIGVYRGYIDSANKIAFEPVSELIFSVYFQSPLNLYVSRADIPAIADIDGDQDLDILTFYILGTCIEYHKNLSREYGYGADSLIFQLESDNWGLITESANDNSINYNDSCGRSGERHTGSTLLLHDLNSDGNLDLLLGDVSYPNPLFLINQPSGNTDMIIPLPANYPEIAWQQVGVPIFPGLFSIQSNTDDTPDLLIAPNTDQQSVNIGRVMRRYRTSPGNNFSFTLAEEPFITDETLDFGQNAAPALGDIDGDGDLDLVVGNSGKFSNGVYTSNLSVYQNIGTATNPEFLRISADVLNLSAENHVSISPALADLNADNKADLVLGFYNGTLRLYFSDGLFGFTAASSSVIPGDGGDWANPELFDINSDGKKDLITGNKQGQLKAWLNLGTNTSPQFDATETEWMGSVIETIEEGISNNGYSAPRLLLFQNDTFLLSGSERGSLFVWSVINGSLSEADSTFLSLDEGAQSTLATGDLNADGFPDIIIGNRAGGLTYYQGIMPNGQAPFGDALKANLKIYPNPTSGILTIEGLKGNGRISIHSVLGKIERKFQFDEKLPIAINLEELADGIYFLSIQSNLGSITTKFILSR